MNEEMVFPIKVLCGFEYSSDPTIKPTGLYHKYFKVKMGVVNRMWVVKSSRRISREEYEKLLKKEEENKQKKKSKLTEFTFPPNPWRFR